ncbi:ABC transporter ATP-binding protein [Oligella urethralis]|uniref:iron ABC transporter ATP-binding protein n=1 Tax=Oligella urethralis TaxID=90245 RepID=UPI000E02E741|nr:ATP-binding cassette domain-containing protein [Oligella urethralis]SUA59257.1 Probable siderophore transport system ATP-binding protein YusV [Oligella urethralis]
MITIDQVSFQIRGTEILKNINLEIPKGGITALVGPNGAGKSTLFSLMSRLNEFEQGKISIDGMDISKTPSDEMAKKIAILRQENSITSRIMVKEMLMFGRYPYHKGRPTEEDQVIVENTLRRFDLYDLRGRYLTELSGGQRQRVLVAMVFCQSTDYLLLDEPLNNLDMYHSRQLMRQLRHIADEHQRTIIVVLHDVNYASAYADSIVGLKQGELVLHGKPRDVLNSDNLEKLFGVDAQVVDVNGHNMVMHYL